METGTKVARPGPAVRPGNGPGNGPGTDPGTRPDGAGPAVSPRGRPTLRPLRDPAGLPPPLRIRRAVALLLATLAAPGLAQLAAGDRRVGRWALRAWAALVGLLAALGILALTSRSAAVWLLARPIALWTGAIVCFLLAAAWPVLVVDAWRLGRMRLLPMRARRGVAVLTAVLLLVTTVPLLASGRRLWAAGGLVSDVFAGGGSGAAVDGRYNVLLLGGDAGAGRIGLRPDSITLASIDSRTGRTVLFGLPRNLENVPFPAGTPAAKALPRGWSCGDECLLNGLYTWGNEHRQLFPGAADPGAAAMKQAVEALLGLPVNYYVLIDLRGFQSLIDALGGIKLTVGERVPIGGGSSRVKGYIEPGTRTLDGYHALWFARSRHGASDYARMARQRCVMSAMLQQLDPTTVLRNFQSIATAGKQVVSTDVPASRLSTFLGLASRARTQKVSSVQFVPPLIRPAAPDLALIKRTVTAALERSASEGSQAGAATRAAAPPKAAAPTKAAGRTASARPAPSSSVKGPTGSPDAEDVARICTA